MTSEFMKNMPMDRDFDSGWIPVFSDYPFADKFLSAESLQIFWKDVSGAMNGEIEILATTSLESAATGMKITVESEANIGDSYLFLLQPSFEYLRIKYTANGIETGKLSIIISYR